MDYSSFVCSFIVLIGFSCTNHNSNATRSAKATSIDTFVNASLNKGPAAGPADDTIKEIGLLRQVEDSGYPFAVLTIEFPERKFTEEFTINLEESDMPGLPAMSAWVGQYVSFTYTSEPANVLLDLQQNGKSLLDEKNASIGADTEKIAGILSGADEETSGDLPGSITITAPDKSSQSFPFFITREIADANGSAVLGLYEERIENKIKSIKQVNK